MATETRIDTYLEEHLASYIDLIIRLCKQPSISSSGEGVEQCARLVCEVLNEHEINTAPYQTPGFPIIIGKKEGKSKRTLLFYNHYDVQPADPLELWDHPPFEPAVEAGKLYARGARDDKGEFVSRIAAVMAVNEVLGYLPCNVKFLLEGEEECGSPHLTDFVQNHIEDIRSDGAIWEEGYVEAGEYPTLTLGVRGILYIEMSVQTMTADAHSGLAHVLPNAAWRLHNALRTIRSSDSKILIPGFYKEVIKPDEKEKALFDKWPDAGNLWKEQYGLMGFSDNLEGSQLRYAVFDPTCNLDGFGSGYLGYGTKTVIPSKAMAKMDFRLVPNQDPEDIVQKLRHHLNDEGFGDIEIKVLGKMNPFRTPIDDPLVDLSVRKGEEVYGKPVLIGPIATWSSPVHAVAHPLGIPVVNPGIGYWDNRSHAPNEHIRIKDFLNGARHIARIILDFDKLLPTD